jgi:hypothetical protein
MNKAPLLLLAAFALASLSPAAETTDQTYEQQLKAFQKIAATALAPKPGAIPGDRRSEGSFFALSQLSQFSLNNNQPNFQELERILSSITLQAPDNTELARAAEALVATAKAERETRVNRSRAEIESLLQNAGQACLAAKTPADLDATLLALAPYSRQSGYDRRQDDPESWQRGANAYRFVCRWQDYLAARSQSGPSETPSNILREISSSLDPAMMPRSTLLGLINPGSAKPAADSPADSLAAAINILEKATTPDHLLAALRTIPRNTPGYSTGNLQQVLVALLEERHQVRAGNRPLSVFSTDGQRQLSPQDPAYTTAVQSALLAFRRETQLAALRSSFPRETLPSPDAADSPEAYLLRVIDHFVAAKNWLQAREALELYRSGFNNTRAPAWLSADIEAFGAFLGGLNLERAAQHAAAVSAYQRALRNPGRHLPVEEISARLAAIKQSHPDAFSGSPSLPGAPASRLPGEIEGRPSPSIPRGPVSTRPAPVGP